MQKSFFADTGAHVLVDGQYGSTGKGVLGAYLARKAIDEGATAWGGVVSNAGPNSGHTFYHNGEKIVLKQLPTFAVAAAKMGLVRPIYLSAGAIIDPEILRKEAEAYPGPIYIHPNAAVITQDDKDSEHSGTVAAVAGTRSGTGAALARKVLRDPNAVAGAYFINRVLPNNVYIGHWPFEWDQRRYFVEVSQGFSLGINQIFYPKCTSRECTVSQALSDASIPPQGHARTYMAIRTYPIRVGNVDGHSSGDWYPDQAELSWDQLGQTPELTTVTQRVRRVAEFSEEQFVDACRANAPDWVFVNFLNYLHEDDRPGFMQYISALRDACPQWFGLLASTGPTSKDVVEWRG